MLKAPFKTLDDQSSIVGNPLIHDDQHIKEIFTRGYFNDHSYYRPLVLLSFMEEYRSFGLNPFFYNLDNLLLHLINTLLVWVLVGLILENFNLGFWAGLLFILHPIHVEAVSNISGRAILLSTTFVLSAFIGFLLYQRQGKLRFLLGALAVFTLGLLCKESSAVLPGVIFFYLIFKKKSLKSLWPFGVIIGFYILLRYYLGMTETFAWRNLGEHILGIVTFLRSLITDLRLFVFPVDLYFDRSQRLFLSFSDLEFSMTIFIWTVVLLWLLISRRYIQSIGWFSLSWLSLELLPVSQIVTTIGVSPGVISCANHFLYLASIPIFIILIEVTKNLMKINQQRKWFDGRIFKVAIGAFLIFLFVMNIEQNIYASNELGMLQRSIQIQPINARMQFSVGRIYALNGQFVKAKECFLKAVSIDPANPRYRIAVAKSICDQGNYQQCLDLYNRIDDSGPFAKLLQENKEATIRLINQHAQILSK